MRLLVYFLSFMLFSVAAMAQSNMELYPSRIFFHQNEGKIQQKVIHVINKSDKRIICKVEIVDWTRDTTGNKKYVNPGTLPTSAAPLLELPSKIITLEPFQDYEYTLTIDQSQVINQFKNAMIFFTELETTETQVKKGIKILLQLGAHIYSVPESVEDKELTIKNTKWRNNEKPTLHITISNLTNLVIDSKIKGVLMDQFDQKIQESEYIMISSMPRDQYDVLLPFTQLTSNKNGTKIILYIDNGFEYPLQIAEVLLRP